MLIKKILLRRKEQRLMQQRENQSKRTGIYFGVELETEKRGFPIWKYLLNALLLFCCTYGSLICFVSAFPMEISRGTLAWTCAMLAMLFAGMYMNKWLKYSGYLLVLFICIFVLTGYYRVINSGMSAILNICLDRINDVFPLARLKEYTEILTDRYYTVTMALCVIALLITMVLNIFISEYMNFFYVFLCTFPFVQVGMYFGFEVETIPMIMVMGSWVIILVLRMTGVYDGLANQMKTKSSIKKNVNSYGFSADPGHCASMGMIILCVILAAVSFLNFFVPKKEFAISTFADHWKEMTNQPVKNVLSYGLYALLPSGMNRSGAGSIANAKSVSFNGQTDLVVTMANYGADRIYLRNFTGQRYIPFGYRWISSEESSIYVRDYTGEKQSIPELLQNLPALTLQQFMEEENLLLSLEHRIRVKIVDDGLLLQKTEMVPYYSLLEKGKYSYPSPGEVQGTEDADTREYTVYSINGGELSRDYFRDSGKAVKNKTLESMKEVAREYYYQYVLTAYLEVPEVNLPVLEKICKENHLEREDPNLILKVTQFLKDNYDYTVKPGRVPKNEEYVNYFLANSKRGYCVHFATSATLLFRYLGIPARYAEGYVVDWGDMDRGKVLEEEDPADWLKGGNTENVTVVEANITDANGHAWVEIYYPDFGWVPLEVTNSLSIDSDKDSILSSIFGNGQGWSAVLGNPMNLVNQENVEKTVQNVKKGSLAMVFVLFGVYLLRLGILVVPRKATMLRADREGNPYPRYCHLQQIMEYRNFGKKEYFSYSEFLNKMREEEILSKEETEEFLLRIERILYSGKKATKEEYVQVRTWMNKCKKGMIREMNIWYRIKFYLWKAMW